MKRYVYVISGHHAFRHLFYPCGCGSCEVVKFHGNPLLVLSTKSFKMPKNKRIRGDKVARGGPLAEQIIGADLVKASGRTKVRKRREADDEVGLAALITVEVTQLILDSTQCITVGYCQKVYI